MAAVATLRLHVCAFPLLRQSSVDTAMAGGREWAERRILASGSGQLDRSAHTGTATPIDAAMGLVNAP
jgi:hypothetical protein